MNANRNKPVGAVWNRIDDEEDHWQNGNNRSRPVIQKRSENNWFFGARPKSVSQNRNFNKRGTNSRNVDGRDNGDYNRHTIANRAQSLSNSNRINVETRRGIPHDESKYAGSSSRNQSRYAEPTSINQPKHAGHSTGNNSKHTEPSRSHSKQIELTRRCKSNHVEQSAEITAEQNSMTEPITCTRDGEKSCSTKEYFDHHAMECNPVSKKKQKSMSVSQIKELTEKSNNEILLTVLNKESGFGLVLQQQSIKRDLMAYVLISLGKAVVATEMTNNIARMINEVTSNSTFFLINVQQYLVSFQREKSESYHLDSLTYLVTFLQKFQGSLPSTAADILPILLPLLKQTCEKSLAEIEESRHEVVAKLQEIENHNAHHLQKYTLYDMKKASHNEMLQFQEPPESYRSIPVLPNVDDIRQFCSFLRPNIVKGRYQDTEHYLDVQYRLLREDYVRPLRDGIAEYLKLLRQGKTVKHCKDVRVHSDVCIVKQDFVNGGLVHFAMFSDKKFANIKWEYSKRFLTGSLLCLSSDNFESMLFASVARRDPKDLVKGLLLLRFEELTDEVLNLDSKRSFVVIETTAYFESYRYNLKALLEINENNLPLKQYIVETQNDVGKPKYLENTTTYDMQPLFLPLNDSFIEHKQDRKGKFLTSYRYPTKINEAMKNITVLNDNHWPTCSELDLDSSQYAALKAAITKEFVVIQGPPGTGKTFVGLRIAQLLLHNAIKWQPEINPSPILVICYTNHALDQFLEGLLVFTKRIIRIGGRGTNKAIAEYQINNVKFHIKKKREVPHYIFSSIKQKDFDCQTLKNSINKLQESITKIKSTILSEDILRKVVPLAQYASLKELELYLPDDGLYTHDWLCIRYRSNDPLDECYAVPEESIEPVETKRIVPVDESSYTLEAEEDSDGEADIDYIEAERDIDADEFAGAFYEAPLDEDENIQDPMLGSGWQIQGGKKAVRKYINYHLKLDPMREVDALKIENVWKLTLKQRWRLYKYWLSCFLKDKEKELYDYQKQLKKEYNELCEMRIEEDINVCKQALVVGMTTTGAAKYRHIVQNLNPRILIVEEAAEILECHIVTALARDTQHVILIGDHQQLRPSPTVHMLAVKYDLNVSLFERMVKNEMPCYRLGIQHRMRPEIAALLVPHIYDSLENHVSVTQLENIKGVHKNMFFINHSFSELQEYDSKSRVNVHEAKFLARFCKYLLHQGYDASQITILTTYSGQLFELKRLARGGLLQSVKCTVVDNYQGEENEIILVSFVRSNEDGQIGFLKISNRVCVALSRAKKGLYCIGNFDLLAEKSELWNSIVGVLKSSDAIGPSLQLLCQNHPEVSNVVSNDSDFDSVPEGGCSRKCEFRLPCGHVCSLMCHPYDPEHETFRCDKPCPKSCKKGHPCVKKCYENCGSCCIKVPKTFEECGHTIQVLCYRRNRNVPCTNSCDKYLSCGHMCPHKCSEPCAVLCREKIKIKSPACGHNIVITCCDSGDTDLYLKKCKAACTAELLCGHMCVGDCSSCYQGRLHVSCNRPCKRILVCGHECTSPCSKSCPPCQRPCENRCVHSKCPKLCGEPCEKCTEACAWTCEHASCVRLCGDRCDRSACSEPCQKELNCKHQCIGLCGDPCPEECLICDAEKVKEVFFGSEEDVGARFVRLEDCGHVFELDGITRWMNRDLQNRKQIQMKTCPKCKTVVRKSLRFGNIVKSCLQDVEKVKKITFGDTQQNKQKQVSLLRRLLASPHKAEVFAMCAPVTSVLAASKIRSAQTLTTIENVVNILLLLIQSKASNRRNRAKLVQSVKTPDPNRAHVDSLKSYSAVTEEWVLAFIRNEFLTASEQQLHELTFEVHRLKLVHSLADLLREHAVVQPNPHVQNLLAHLMTTTPFRDADVEKCKSEFESLLRLVGGAVINISDLEKESVLKAMALTRGHWFQCPNGHVYCITECGGATEESQCNECGSKIGGRNHSLLSDNRVATAMDGATHSAWSEDMNLANVIF